MNKYTIIGIYFGTLKPFTHRIRGLNELSALKQARDILGQQSNMAFVTLLNGWPKPISHFATTITQKAT